MSKQPTSVVHYTSLQVLYLLLNGALTSSSGTIMLHLSQLTMMNDSGEGRYVLDKFYTAAVTKQQLKDDWENNYYPSHIPFILSTIATDMESRNRGSLPMWKMYGDDFQGVLLRFNRKKLEKYCTDNNLLFSQCQYRTAKEIASLIKDFNKKSVSFDDLMLQSCISKRPYWSYEKEWRIIAYSSKDKVKVKNTLRGLVEYIELPLPIDMIEEICLGPLCEKENSERTLSLLKDKLRAKYGDKINFTISRSPIKIK